MLKNQKKTSVKKSTKKISLKNQKKTSVKKSTKKTSSEKKKGGNSNQPDKTSKKNLVRTNAINPYGIETYTKKYHDMIHLPLIPGLQDVGPQKRATVKEFNSKNKDTIYLGGRNCKK